MKIKLINFRCYEDATIIIENNKLNLLDGVSGIGKSTIFNAIYWCLYGNLQHIHSLKNNRKSTTVILEINGVTIQRIKPPEVFKITTPEIGTIQGSEAKSYIENMFGNKDIFIISSYLAQNTQSPFISWSNAEIINILRTLTFNNSQQTPDYYLNKIKDRLKTITSLYQEQFGKYNEKKDTHSNNVIKYDEYIQKWKKRPPKKIVENIISNQNKILDKLKIIKEQEIKRNNLKTIQSKIILNKPTDINIEYLQNKLVEINKLIKEKKECNYFISQINDIDYLISLSPDDKLKELEHYESLEVKYNENLYIMKKYKINNLKEFISTQKYFKEYKEWKQYDEKYKIDLYNYNLYIEKENIEKQIKNLIPFYKLNEEELELLKHFEDLSKQYNFSLNNYKYYMKKLDQEIDYVKNYSIIYEKYQKTINQIKDQEEKLKQWEIDTNKQIEEINYKKKLYKIKEKEYLEYLNKIKTYEDRMNYLKEYIENKTLEKSFQDTDAKILECPNCKIALYYSNDSLYIKPTDKDLNDKIKELSEIKLLYDECPKIEKPTPIENIKLIPKPTIINLEYPKYPEKPLHSLEYLENEKEQLSKIKTIKIPNLEENLISITRLSDCKDKWIRFNEIQVEKVNKPIKRDFNLKSQTYSLEDINKILDDLNNVTYIDDIKTIKERINNLKRLSEITSKWDRLKQLEKETLEDESKEIEIKINKYQKEIIEYNYNLKLYKDLEEQIASIKEEERDLQSLEKEYLDEENKLNKYKNLLVYYDILTNIDEEEKQLEIEYNKLKDYESNITNLKQLHKIIEELQDKYFQRTIDNLNTTLNVVLSKLFDEEFYAIFKTETNFSLQIYYKGNLYDSVKYLSGGEMNRFSIALIITFSRLSRSPFLLLDESMNALDTSLREKCIKCLKEFINNKTIINICHESEIGLYENVISL